ncbi:MAG TPA: hypothetical protein VFE13_12180, partial [Caulobacteraceae bacterium]|nr:hypothetical protein [Caulobacteraceae bacterium]
MTRLRAVIGAAAASAISAGAAHAQPLSRAELERALAQRDRQIEALEKRIAALETGHQPAPSTTAEAAAPDGEAANAAAPGSGDDAALEALSRGLVQHGLLLLPPWSVEVAPGLAYTHSQDQGLVPVDTPEGISTVSSQRRRDDGIEPEITARIGLPWRSQLQVSAPFDWKRDSAALGDGTVVANSSAHVGDVQVELIHQFMVESDWRPDLIAAVAWRAPTGLDPYKAAVTSVANSAGANGVSGRITVLKTLEPIVGYSTVSYTHNFIYPERFGRVDAGDDIDWQIGGLLSVSPDTSLSFGFDQQFKTVTRVDGVKIPGSDGVAAVAHFGLDQVLNARTLLDLS